MNKFIIDEDLENQFLKVFVDTFKEKGSKLGSIVSSDLSDDKLVSWGESHRWNDNILARELIYKKENGNIIFKIDNTSSCILKPVYCLGAIKDKVIIRSMLEDTIVSLKNNEFIKDKLLDYQKIKDNHNEGLTIEKLLLARKIFDDNEILDKEQYCVLNIDQLRSLYNNIDRNSKCFKDVEKIIKAESDELLGFKIIRIHSDILPKIGNIRKIICFAKSGIHYENFNEKISVSLSTLHNDTIDIAVSGTFFAVRLDSKKVVEIECYED